MTPARSLPVAGQFDQYLASMGDMWNGEAAQQEKALTTDITDGVYFMQLQSAGLKPTAAGGARVARSFLIREGEFADFPAFDNMNFGHPFGMGLMRAWISLCNYEVPDIKQPGALQVTMDAITKDAPLFKASISTNKDSGFSNIRCLEYISGGPAEAAVAETPAPAAPAAVVQPAPVAVVPAPVAPQPIAAPVAAPAPVAVPVSASLAPAPAAPAVAPPGDLDAFDGMNRAQLRKYNVDHALGCLIRDRTDDETRQMIREAIAGRDVIDAKEEASGAAPVPVAPVPIAPQPAPVPVAPQPAPAPVTTVDPLVESMETFRVAQGIADDEIGENFGVEEYKAVLQTFKFELNTITNDDQAMFQQVGLVLYEDGMLR